MAKFIVQLSEIILGYLFIILSAIMIAKLFGVSLVQVALTFSQRIVTQLGL